MPTRSMIANADGKQLLLNFFKIAGATGSLSR